MKYFIILSTFIAASLFASDHRENAETGWNFEISTLAAYYYLETLTIDGSSAVGDGGIGDYCADNLNACDVIGAFVEADDGSGEICVGWQYALEEGYSEVPVMGDDGFAFTAGYAVSGEVPSLKVYDASNGSILEITPGSEVPGWVNLTFPQVSGTSTANNTFGCTADGSCNYDSDATADDGSCWSANAGCSCSDGPGSTTDCAGVCNGSSTEDDCGVCAGGNASQDCAGVCDGNSAEDNCGVCDDDASNDDVSCTGCMNSDADNYNAGNSIEDGSCVYTVNPATNLTTNPGPARMNLNWEAPVDAFTQSSAGYEYDIYVDAVYNKTTSQLSTQIGGLDSATLYCFTVLAVHKEYGDSDTLSNESCNTPGEATGDPTWRIQVKAEIDSYDQFQFSGNADWLLYDTQNFLGVASDATYGWDAGHDAPEPPQGPGNYIKLFFDHPEWNEWVTHFTEDIVLEDDAFFSSNLTQWNIRVQSDVPGSTVLRFETDLGVIPTNYELYVELDGEYTRLDHSEETAIEFYMDGSGQQDLAVYIGNIVPQAPDNLVITDPAGDGNYNTLGLDWDSDGADLNDIGNRYPATSYNVYRDDEPSDYNSNVGSPGTGPGGCGGLLSGAQNNTDYFDNANLYPEWDYTSNLSGGELLMQESTYSYTVTGNNNAGESSEGHTVRLSGGSDPACTGAGATQECSAGSYDGDTWYNGRGSSTSAMTGANADPESVPVYMESPNGTNVDVAAGLYEIPHNNDPDANKIVIPIGAWGTNDPDFPYANLQYFDYEWTEVDGPFTDITDVVGLTLAQLSFKADNAHEDGAGGHNGDKSYTWNLKADAQHPVRVQADPKTNNMTGDAYFSGCGGWTTSMHMHSHDQDITVTIQPEPNSDPIAAAARDLPRFGDGASVVTSDQYDNIGGVGNDFNDYDDTDNRGDLCEEGETPWEDDCDSGEAHFGVWYEPHDNNIVHEVAGGIINYFADNADFGNNNAELYFTAADSDDLDGMCDGSVLVCADFGAFVNDCSGDGDCCPAEWIGDGWADCADQAAGCDLTCYENDGGDCDADANNCPADPYTGEQYIEDCSGDGDCAPAGWVGDGWCDGTDEPYGYDLTCYENDGGDCDAAAGDTGGSACDAGYVDDCSGDGDCCPQSWIGDGWADCADQAAGCDLTCYANDGGDCDAGRSADEGRRTPNRDAWWIPDTERYTEIISSNSRAASTFCDEQSYEWFYTKGSAAAFNYLDLNSNGIYDIGERFSLIDNNAIVQEFTPEEFWDDNESGFWDVDEEYVDENGNGLYDVGTDLGSYLPPNQEQFGACGDSCTPGSFTADGDTEAVGYYGHGQIDLHAEFQDNVYILTLKVTDAYNDVDYRSLLFVVKDERNSAPVANVHRPQPTAGDAYYVDYGEDTKEVSVKDNASCTDNLGAVDSDNDDLEYEWTYTGDDGIDLSGFDSDYAHSNGATPGGWLDADADLSVGTHTFTFTVTDSYNATSSESTTFEIREEPTAANPTVVVDSTDLKYTIIHVEDNELAPYTNDDCYGEVYDGADFNTQLIKLYNTTVDADNTIAEWVDGDGVESTFDVHIDKALEAETYYEYKAVAYNSNLLDAESASSVTSTTTHDRPDVTVLTPNGAEIRSIGDNFDVDFSTTQKEYISKIEVFYLANGVTEVAGVNSAGTSIGSNMGVHVDGVSSGDNTENFEISDNSGAEINYNAKVVVRVHDVGNYDGGNVQYHDDISDFPFTMAAHLLTNDYLSGWHLLGPPLTPWDNNLVENFGGSLGNWGADWVAYDVEGYYDNLTLRLGEGYYLALANNTTLVQEGDPVIADPDCNACIDTSFALADLSLNKGWNLIANPLVNKVDKSTFTITDESGLSPGVGDLDFADAVDAGWIAPTIYGWFENSYVSIDRIMPFDGYWINTSRDLTIKVRPHLFENGELTRKAEDMVTSRLELRARDIAGDGMSDFITVGLAENADDEFVYGEDEYDLPRQAYASMGGEFIDMKIGSDLMRDIKSAEYDGFQAWTISIEREKVDNDIELSWGDVSGFEDDLHIVINGEAIDMHTQNTLELSTMIDEAAIVVGNVDAYLNPIPDEFGLSAAYPNPFNPTTTLGLALNADGFVSMSVYNIRGQVVEVLVDRNMNAGYHNITWNADGISSGMYFVKVETGVNAAIQKLMLLK